MVITSGGMDDAGVGKYPKQGLKGKTPISNVMPNGKKVKPKKQDNTTNPKGKGKIKKK